MQKCLDVNVQFNKAINVNKRREYLNTNPTNQLMHVDTVLETWSVIGFYTSCHLTSKDGFLQQ